MIPRLILAACVAFGLHYGVKWLAATAVTAPAPAPIKIEPAALRKAMEYSRTGTPAQRAAIDDANRRIEELNRNLPPPLPPSMPGMPRR